MIVCHASGIAPDNCGSGMHSDFDAGNQELYLVYPPHAPLVHDPTLPR